MEILSDKLETENLFLVLSSAADLRDKNIEIVKTVTESGYYTIVITSNQPYSVLKKSYEKEQINTDSIFFIDTITKYALGHVSEEYSDCNFLNTPGDLTNIGIAINNVLATISEVKICVIFDSVSTMLIYIPPTNLAKFLHYITNKLRLLGIKGIFLAVNKGLDPEFQVQLSTFVDIVITPDNSEK